MTVQPIPPTIEWVGDRVRLIDQRLLPDRLELIELVTLEELCDAIRALVIRGAPALGAAGAMGVALAWQAGIPVDEGVEMLVSTRPTAVNLAWGARRAASAPDPIEEAVRIAEEDVERNQRIGANGSGLVVPGARVLTHCNTGHLACVGYGTALGVVRAAAEAGRAPTVWVDETRPVLQGARLTAWELDRLGIGCTLIVDSLAPVLMADGEVDLVIVGADRIAANGDVVNKVGTYGLALAAMQHGVQFVVAAPTSTVDLACRTGAEIPVEHRAASEVTHLAGRRVAPRGVHVENRAFDLTPASLVSTYVTEDGIFTAEELPGSLGG